MNVLKLILFLSLTSCSSNLPVNNGCEVFFFTKKNTIITGVIRKQFYWGPPGFGETKNRDSKDTVLVVEFKKSINVFPSKETFQNGEPADTILCIKQIQIVSRIDSKMKKFIGENVVIKGILSHAISGNHHTDAIIEIIEISGTSLR